MGTAGMGEDPDDSVTDGTGRLHDVANVYIADGAAFTVSDAPRPYRSQVSGLGFQHQGMSSSI
jgi:hypothetical protein